MNLILKHCLRETSRKWVQVAAVLSACILAVATGNQIGWSSPTVPKLLDNEMGFAVTENEASLIIMLQPFGYFIGAPIAGFLLDVLGRKKTILGLAVPHIIGWLLIATATSSTALYIGRIVTGIGDGGIFTCLPIYFGEILQPQVRATLAVSHTTGILIGMLLINIYGSFLSITTAAYVSLAIPLLFLATFVWMPESPYFLLAKNRRIDAEISLKTLRLMKNVEDELDQIDKDVRRQLSEPRKVSDIFKIGTNLKAFLIIIGLRTFQQLAGVTALNNYLQAIFERAKVGLAPRNSAMIVGGVQIIFVMSSGRLLDKFGRRPLLLFSYGGTAVVYFILGTFFYLNANDHDMSEFAWFPITGVMLIFIVVSVGAAPIPNLMSGELLSASIKTNALGIINIYSGLATGGSSKIFQWLDYDFGMDMALYVFGGFCLIGLLFCYAFAPETKGRTLEEIQQSLKNNTFKVNSRKTPVDENKCV